MTAGASIEVGELRDLSNRLFNRLLDAGIDRIAVKQEQYWTIDGGDAFSSAVSPQPTMGDVWDDLRDLREEVEAPGIDNATIVGHAFDHLSGLMKLIAFADIDADLTTTCSREQQP